MTDDIRRASQTALRDNTVLRRVSQFGSARSGLSEWRLQRMTAVVLVPLGLYFVGSVLHLVTARQADAKAWLGTPFNALLMLLLVVAIAQHAFVGLRSICADYVHGKASLLVVNLLVRAFTIVFAVAGVLAVLKAFIQQGALH